MRSVYEVRDGDQMCVAFVPGTDVVIDPFKVRRLDRDQNGKPFLELHGVVLRSGVVDKDLSQRLEDLILYSGGFCEQTLQTLAHEIVSELGNDLTRDLFAEMETGWLALSPGTFKSS